MLARLKQYLRDRRGNFATMAAIMFPTLFATVALSVDITTQLDGRADLQNAADAAVLLAMRKMQLEGKVPDHATINDLLKINYPNKESPPTMSMSFDPSTGEMVLHAEAKVWPVAVQSLEPVCRHDLLLQDGRR